MGDWRAEALARLEADEVEVRTVQRPRTRRLEVTLLKVAALVLVADLLVIVGDYWTLLAMPLLAWLTFRGRVKAVEGN